MNRPFLPSTLFVLLTLVVVWTVYPDDSPSRLGAQIAVLSLVLVLLLFTTVMAYTRRAGARGPASQFIEQVRRAIAYEVPLPPREASARPPDVRPGVRLPEDSRSPSDAT